MNRCLLTCAVFTVVLGLTAHADAGQDATPRRGDRQPSPDRGNTGTTVGTAVPRDPGAAPASPAPAQPAQTPAAPKPVERTDKAPGSSPRDSGTPVGEAVPRSASSRPRTRDGDDRNDHDDHHDHHGTHVVYAAGASYGGYYGPYDPWYGWYPPTPPVYAPGPYFDAGAVRLKVKPVNAEVYVDGYYAGIVDDFDGVFQKLRLDAGPHRIEMKAPGFETLGVDIRIEPDHTTTYRGALQTVP